MRNKKKNKRETKENLSVLIPDGESGYALPVLRCLGQMKNVKTNILSNDPRALTRFSRYTNQFISYANDKGNEGRLAAICDFVKKKKVDVVLPVDLQTIRLLSTDGEAVSQLTSIVPLPKTDSLDIAADKWLLAQWLKENQIPCPPTNLLKTDDEFDNALSSIPFPVLIKPRTGSGGRGIEFFENSKTLERYCKEHVSSGEFIIQSFINGYDIDCSVLCHEGKILAHTIQKGCMYGTKRISWPSGIDFLYDDSTFQVVREMIEKFNWSGIAHIDLRYDEQDKQIKVIEMNPRFWATVSASVFAGINFPYLACLSGLKQDFPEIVVKQKRVVRSGTAIRLLAKRFVHRKKMSLYFDNSFLEFKLRDPIPSMIVQYSKIYNKIVRKR